MSKASEIEVQASGEVGKTFSGESTKRHGIEVQASSGVDLENARKIVSAGSTKSHETEVQASSGEHLENVKKSVSKGSAKSHETGLQDSSETIRKSASEGRAKSHETGLQHSTETIIKSVSEGSAKSNETGLQASSESIRKSVSEGSAKSHETGLQASSETIGKSISEGSSRSHIVDIRASGEDLDSMGKSLSRESSPRRESRLRSSLFSGRRMSSRLSRHDRSAILVHPLEGKDRDTIIQTVEDLQKQLKHLEIENSVFLNFLKLNDPTCVEDLEENMNMMQERASMYGRRTSVSFRISSRASNQFVDSRKSETFQSVVSGPSHTAPTEILKINLMQRTDLVLREIDDIQAKMDVSYKKWAKIKLTMLSKIEELDTQRGELEESLENFEKFKQSQDEITFQKFVRFMDEWSRKFHQLVDKLRLRYSSLKVQYHKTAATLAHKKLIGENLQEIDFEQLRIENLHLVEKIDNQTLLLLELKKMTGAGNLTLSQQKKILLAKIEAKQKLTEEIEKVEQEVAKSDDQIYILTQELEKVRSEYDDIKEKVTSYTCPEVLDYIKTKVELKDLKRDLKVWSRRVNVKHLALNVATARLRKMIGGRPLDPLWLA